MSEKNRIAQGWEYFRTSVLHRTSDEGLEDQRCIFFAGALSTCWLLLNPNRTEVVLNDIVNDLMREFTDFEKQLLADLTTKGLEQ